MSFVGSDLLTLRILDDAAAAEELAADIIAAEMTVRTHRVLGLATGRSMLGVYRHLVRLHRLDQVSFAGLTSFNLDEYCGLHTADTSSFAQYMQREFFGLIDADFTRLHLPNVSSNHGCEKYEALIAASGGIDLQLLGIGQNGHIGFNEPGSAITSRTRVVELEPHTRAANIGDFPAGATVPSHAVTMGIATILETRRIVLLATGAAKASALAQALEGPIGSGCPASFLRTHRDLTIVCDQAAAKLLQHKTEHHRG